MVSSRRSVPLVVLSWADSFMHWLAARGGRHFYWSWLCDRMDIALGVPDKPENFPERHGYYRMSHVASSNGSYWSERLRCHHCQREMADWDQPCVLAPIPRGLKAAR